MMTKLTEREVRAALAAEREYRIAIEAERDAARADAAEYRAMIDRCRERNKELGAEAAELQAERDEIIAALDEYGWWMDNPNMLERLKFALAVGQEKSDDLATLQLAAQGAWSAPASDNNRQDAAPTDLGMGTRLEYHDKIL